MSFQSLLAVTQRLNASVETLAAIGAELELRQSGAPADPRVRERLRDVIENVEPGLLDGLSGDQEAIALGSINAFFRQALDLMDEPGRTPNWSFKDPAILQSYGQMSRSVIHAINELAPQIPDFSDTLRRPGTLLDVGTGVGWLAIEAARTWPALRVVGIDPWEPALDLARQNVASTGMTSRIELRMQRLEDVSDRDAFALAWVAGPFLPPEVMAIALMAVRAALKPGGWLVFGLFPSPPDPLGRALTALKVVRSGGHPWSNEEVEGQLQDAGFEEIKSFAPPHLARFIVGRRGTNARA